MVQKIWSCKVTLPKLILPSVEATCIQSTTIGRSIAQGKCINKVLGLTRIGLVTRVTPSVLKFLSLYSCKPYISKLSQVYLLPLNSTSPSSQKSAFFSNYCIHNSQLSCSCPPWMNLNEYLTFSQYITIQELKVLEVCYTHNNFFLYFRC